MKPSQLKYGWGKYCSVTCRNKSQLKGNMFKCFICGREIYRSPTEQRHSEGGKFFCSKLCQTRWRNSYFSGEKHSNWKGGVATYRDILHNSNRIKVCIMCKIDNLLVLTAHHIDHDRKNNKLSNLTWLCLNCHYLVHHDQKLDKMVKNSEFKV